MVNITALLDVLFCCYLLIVVTFKAMLTVHIIIALEKTVFAFFYASDRQSRHLR